MINDKSVSTLRNISEITPSFPLGNVCGLYGRLPNNGHLIEGGLRIEGKYKQNNFDNPLITFITVVFNNQKMLLRCMEGVWAQDYDNIEFIIIDGGSTDGTLQLLQHYADRIDYFISEPDKGIYNAINKGLSLASGSMINILGSDDWIEQHAAKTAVSLMKQGVELLASTVKLYNEKGLFHSFFSPRLPDYDSIFSGIPMNHNGIYAVRSVYEKTGYYDENYKICADHKWILTAFQRGCIIRTTNDVLVNYTLGGTSAQIDQAIEEGIRIIGDFFEFLTSEECKILYKNLTGSHLFRINTVSNWVDGNVLAAFFQKYADKPELICTLSQAVCLRFTECRDKIYHNPYMIMTYMDEQNEKTKGYRWRLLILTISALLKGTIFYSFVRYLYHKVIKKGICYEKH